VDFLKKVSARKVLTWGKPADRLKEFRDTFGDDLQALDRDFLNFMRGVK
jgi:hypothetical protein